MTANDVDAKLRGLSQVEARQRLAAHGPNALPEASPLASGNGCSANSRARSSIFCCSRSPSILPSGCTKAPSSSIRSPSPSALILVLNAGLGAYQESKAEEALARLKALATPSVWVKRDGALVQIPASELVPGDIARIEAGDRVPADGRLVEGQGVMADESILTGESLPIDKDLQN